MDVCAFVARCVRYGAGHQGPGAPVLAGAAQRAVTGVHLRRREARTHPVCILTLYPRTPLFPFLLMHNEFA